MNLGPKILVQISIGAGDDVKIFVFWSRVARFFLIQNTKTGKKDKITTKYNKWSNIYQMAVK
jgi:hypothetical protein